MRIKPYDEYKNSESKLVKKIPAHWDESPLKWHIQSNDGGTWGEEPVGGEHDALVLRSTEQTVDGNWCIERPAKRSLSESENKATLLEEGDLLITKSSGSSLHIGKTTLVTRHIADLRCHYSNFMQRLRLKSSLRPKLCWYILNNNLSREQFNYLSNSTTGLANLNAKTIGSIYIPIPKEAEQVSILNFLDKETAKIDDLISKQEQLIELLHERKQATISTATTNGLNPSAPKKHSGVEWLEEVPEHWAIKKISKVTTKITNGYVGPTRDILRKEGIPYIQATHVKEGELRFDQNYFVDKDWSDNHAKSILTEGDVLIVQTGAGTGDIGYVSKKESGFNCHALIILSSKEELCGQYLANVLMSAYGKQYLESIQTGGMHPHLNCGNVKFMQIPIPPICEQLEIISLIKARSKKFNELISQAEKSVSVLKERRSALISAAVTGQIDVHGLVDEEEVAV